VRARLLVTLVFVLVAALPASHAEDGFGSGAVRSSTYSSAGLTVTLPSGWHVVRRQLTPCVDPTERLTLSGRRALLMLQERRHPRAREFSARPHRFALRGTPQPIACCAPTGRPGWFFNFRDGGRGFYVYMYLGAPGTRAEVLAILDSLRVRVRGR
jgi:hypothetical protein